MSEGRALGGWGKAARQHQIGEGSWGRQRQARGRCRGRQACAPGQAPAPYNSSDDGASRRVGVGSALALSKIQGRGARGPGCARWWWSTASAGRRPRGAASRGLGRGLRGRGGRLLGRGRRLGGLLRLALLPLLLLARQELLSIGCKAGRAEGSASVRQPQRRAAAVRRRRRRCGVATLRQLYASSCAGPPCTAPSRHPWPPPAAAPHVRPQRCPCNHGATNRGSQPPAPCAADSTLPQCQPRVRHPPHLHDLLGRFQLGQHALVGHQVGVHALLGLRGARDGGRARAR